MEELSVVDYLYIQLKKKFDIITLIFFIHHVLWFRIFSNSVV